MPDPGTLQKIYRVFSWGSLVGLILVVILVLRKSPRPDVPYDPAGAERVEQKFAAADRAKATGEPAQVQIDRTELNSYLSQNLLQEGVVRPTGTISGNTSATGPGDATANDRSAALTSSDPQTVEQAGSSVKDVKVDMDGDLFKAYVIFDFHGRDLSLELDGHLGARDGYVTFQPVAGKLGSLPLPQSTLDSAVARMMSSPENRGKLKLPDDISDIQIVNGKVVLSYR